MWGPILEKAWAKVKGTYGIADAGLVQIGLTTLTGAPIMSHILTGMSDTDVDAFYLELVAADKANYLMGSGTRGTND